MVVTGCKVRDQRSNIVATLVKRRDDGTLFLDLEAKMFEELVTTLRSLVHGLTRAYAIPCCVHYVIARVLLVARVFACLRARGARRYPPVYACPRKIWSTYATDETPQFRGHD